MKQKLFARACTTAGMRVTGLLISLPFAIWTLAAEAQQTVADAQCMQDRAGFSLTCTANDVGIAGVARNSDGSDDITIIDPCSQAGDSVTFTARFDVLLTAQERHDIGIYFATDGDPNGDGALTGSCSVSTLAITPDPPWVDLDGTSDPYPGQKKSSGVQDTCGDIDANHNPLFPVITVTAVCVDDDGDGFLDLPNCVSWRQSGANELCQGPTDTFPGSPSKCKCDAGFNVPVPVPANVSLVKEVKKAGDPDSAYGEVATLDEPGGSVTYRIKFTVLGNDKTPDVYLQSLTDDLHGDITQVQGDITSTTCSIPAQPLDGNGGSYSCTFTASISGDGGDEFPDEVTATATDGVGNQFTRKDTAKVVIADKGPAITIVKTANPTSVVEPGGNVSFSFLITNTSVSSDPVTIDTLIDTVYGDLNGKGDCSVPQTIAGNNGTYSCSFTVFVAGNYTDSETNVVTASGTDDEGNPVSDDDSANVLVTNTPSSITLTKTASASSLPEPGGPVVFTLVVTNTSSVDSVTITSLTDTVFGDLNGQGDCSVPQALGNALSGNNVYTCSFTANVTGNANASHTNTATAAGTDDDGASVMASDDENVGWTDVPPAASLTKTATGLLVTYEVQVFNESPAEALTLSELDDDQFGDITQVQGDVTQTTCSVPQSIAVGASYTCSFKAIVTTSPHTNTLTGTVSDDDGGAITPSDDATVSFE